MMENLLQIINKNNEIKKIIIHPDLYDQLSISEEFKMGSSSDILKGIRGYISNIPVFTSYNISSYELEF